MNQSPARHEVNKAMQGLVGWMAPGGIDAPQTLNAMLIPSGSPQANGMHSVLEAAWGMASWGTGADLAQDGGLAVALIGRPLLYSDNASHRVASAAEFLALWADKGRSALERLHGSFALAVLDRREQSVVLAIDRIGNRSLAFAGLSNGLVFANRADSVAAHPEVGTSIDPQGLFNYFYFHDVPAPGTIFKGVEKLLPGQWLRWHRGKLERGFYWQLHYRDEPRKDFEAMSGRFRHLLRECVGRAAEPEGTAAFLSGGTDSSTVAGILTEIQGKPARTYSIGFSADGFDEMEYARIATRHFGLDAREYYLKPDDILTAIPIIAGFYDEPFANESAVPAYFCARMAHEDGYRIMLAGDGGDEIFGGNARYAKQKIFEAYHAIPIVLRGGLIEPLARLPGLSALPPMRKLQSYIRQASIPLPERMESYNFIYRQSLEEMFTRDFLDQVDIRAPSILLKDAYDRADSNSYLNRMLHLDLKFTLADNDLRKVNGMTEAAGIDVRYPLLDDAMVVFSGEVPPDWKVRGQYLRWFFKTALRSYLPEEIIDKSKHGFGLPFGMWAREYAPLRERIEDRLADFKRRGWLQLRYIDHIRMKHMSGHATYFGKMIWVMLIAEEWMQARSP